MSARIARGAALAAGIALSSVVAGCEPCDGVIGCDSGSARVAVDGRILDPWSGMPVAGTRLTFLRRDGVALADDSVTVVAGADGRFELRVEAAEAGEAIVDVRVESSGPSDPPYLIRDLTLAAVVGRGQGTVLRPWSSRLHFPYSAEIFYRFAPDSVVDKLPLQIRRVGGTAWFGNGVVNDVYTTGTDAFGRVPLFADSAYARSNEDLVVDITATLGTRYGTSTTRGVRLTPSYEYKPPMRVPRIGIGPSLNWGFAFQRRATLQPMANVRLEFRRTGGIPVRPEQFTAVTDVHGIVGIPLVPLADGILLGELVVTPPPPNAPFTLSLEIPTLHEDQGRLFGRWGIGPHLLYYGRIVARDAGVPNVDVELRRTGGVAVEPEVFTARTDAQGYFPMSPAPLGDGELVADLHVRPPAPYAAFVVRGLRMPTSQSEISSARSFGVWDLEHPPAPGAP